MKETPVQQRLRLRLSELGRVNWRNNNGACYDENGRLIRFGLGNDSEELNRNFKSSDLIGINPVFITPDMIGTVIGQFLAVESKASDWHMTPGDHRAHAQLAWHNIVRQYGGLAGFATGPDDIDRILRGEK
jgi:hypothetical protein